MTEKSKRKANPRRRTLFRLIVFIGIAVALTSYAIYELLPDGAEIVFIAPDDNGIDQIWLANLNHPENPRQLTELDTPVSFPILQTSDHSIMYGVATTDSNHHIISTNIWELHTSAEDTLLFSCASADYGTCGGFAVSPDGEWLAFFGGYSEDNTGVYVYNLKTDELKSVTTTSYTFVGYGVPTLYWLANSNILTFYDYSENYDYTTVAPFTFYDTKMDTIQTIALPASERNPHFSGDGSRYIYYEDNNIMSIEIINDGQLVANIPPAEVLYTSSQTLIQLDKWHPGNALITVTEGDWWHYGNFDPDTLVIYDTLIDEEIIRLHNENRMYGLSHFNAAGTQLLFSKGFNEPSVLPQIAVYNLETREEIPLPLFGRNPQWVNGGR